VKWSCSKHLQEEILLYELYIKLCKCIQWLQHVSKQQRLQATVSSTRITQLSDKLQQVPWDYSAAQEVTDFRIAYLTTLCQPRCYILCINRNITMQLACCESSHHVQSTKIKIKDMMKVE
jgi:hypothetical protein